MVLADCWVRQRGLYPNPCGARRRGPPDGNGTANVQIGAQPILGNGAYTVIGQRAAESACISLVLFLHL